MKKPFLTKLIFLLVVAAGLMACNSASQPEANKSQKDSKTKNSTAQDGEMLPDVKADRLLIVELEGMVCKMGCGGSIREDLYASNAVASVTFDFDEENPVDVARVAFDREKITADEIVAIINKTNDGQFKVLGSHSEPYVSDVPATNEKESTSSENKSSKISMKSTANVDVPDVFDVFSYVL